MTESGSDESADAELRSGSAHRNSSVIKHRVSASGVVLVNHGQDSEQDSMTTIARQASQVLIAHLARLDGVRGEYTIAIAEIASRLARYHFSRSSAYISFRDELAAVLGTEAARQCVRPADQLAARGESSSALKTLLDEDVTLFIAAVIDLHGLQEAHTFVDSVLRGALRKPVLVVSNE